MSKDRETVPGRNLTREREMKRLGALYEDLIECGKLQLPKGFYVKITKAPFDPTETRDHAPKFNVTIEQDKSGTCDPHVLVVA